MRTTRTIEHRQTYYVIDIEWWEYVVFGVVVVGPLSALFTVIGLSMAGVI